MAKLPVAYVSTIYEEEPERTVDGIVDHVLGSLIDELQAAGAQSPAVTALMQGRVPVSRFDHPVLFALGDCHLATMAAWAARLGDAGFASLVACAVDELANDDCISPLDMPLVTGHGVVLASRGMRGEPLVDLPIEELRRELSESKERLSQMAGYPVQTLMPQPTAFGRAVDGLVLKEARRAGYRLVLRPGRSVDDVDASNDGARSQPLQQLQYRTLRTDDSPEHLRDWIVGKSFARGVAQVRELVNRPRRLLSRLGLE